MGAFMVEILSVSFLLLEQIVAWNCESESSEKCCSSHFWQSKSEAEATYVRGRMFLRHLEAERAQPPHMM